MRIAKIQTHPYLTPSPSRGGKWEGMGPGGMRIRECGPKTPNPERSLPSSVLIGGTPNSNGFTLIELVMTIVLVSILAGLAAVIILQGIRAYSEENYQSDAHYQARLAVERMARELRMVNSAGNVGTVAIGTITGNPTSSFIFTDQTGTNVRFWLNGQTLNRTVGVVDSALAVGVTTLDFRHYNILSAPTTTALEVWTIDISLTDTQGSQSLPISTRVHPRNF